MKEVQNKATVVLAKCKRAKMPFGIRMERRSDGVWYYTWAFRLSEKSAVREGYDDAMVAGRVSRDDEYPGCPYCGSTGWFSCGRCGKLTCHQDEPRVTCAWCGNTGEFRLSDTFDLKGGGF